MECIVRGSEYQAFLDCRKKWFHQWVEGIVPNRPQNALFFGSLMHKFLEFYYSHRCNNKTAYVLTKQWFDEQDLSAMEQTEIDDLLELFKNVSMYYHDVYGESDKRMNVLATEVTFLVKLDDELYMTGTIDLVYEIDGKVRFMDHKTTSSITSYVDRAVMDRQISRYWFALKAIADGTGRVKDTDGNWVVWEALQGKTIDGFDYNIIAKDYPRQPKLLKSGKLSVDKSQKTTYDLYKALIHETNQSEHEYKEMLDFLQEKPNAFLRRIDVRRSENEIESAAWEFLYASGEMHDIRLTLTRQPDLSDVLTYRNIGQHCINMCQYRQLCQTAIEGGNVEYLRESAYKQREDV